MIGTPHDYYTAPDDGIAYLEIPKCACTSLKRAMASLILPEVPSGVDIHQEFPREYVLNQGELDRAKYFAFTVARHPIDRFFSFYRGKVLDGWDTFIAPALERIGIQQAMSIREVLDALDSHDPATWERHVRPQHLFLLAESGELTVDFIGRFERLETDWSRILAMTGRQIELGWENPSRRRLKPITITRPEYGDLLDLFERDFQLLGYQPAAFKEAASRYEKYSIKTSTPHDVGAKPESPPRSGQTPDNGPERIPLRAPKIKPSTGSVKANRGAFVIAPSKPGTPPVTLRFPRVGGSGQTKYRCKVRSLNEECRPLLLTLKVVDSRTKEVKVFAERPASKGFEFVWTATVPPLQGPHDVLVSCRSDPSAPDARHSRIKIEGPVLT